MAVANRLGYRAIFTTFVSLLLVPIAGAGDSTQARSLFFRSMRQAQDLNVIAIVEQRGESDGSYRKIKIQQCRCCGKQARTVLQPLSMQGVQVVDNGSQSFTFLPDERVLIKQASNRELARGTEWRQWLAGCNYTFSMSDPSQVAGRRTLTVVAQPKSPQLPKRLFYIDEETLYPLRVIVVSPEGHSQVRLDTMTISYPNRVKSGAFDVPNRTRTVTYKSPQPFEDLPAQESRLGFAPNVPSSLPWGFRVQEMEIQRAPSLRTLVVRITDGLAHATVYQARSDVQVRGISSRGPITSLTDNGVTYTIVSDLPPGVRLKLLGTFVKGPYREPNIIFRDPPKKAILSSSGPIIVPNREPVKMRETFGEIEDLVKKDDVGGVEEKEPSLPRLLDESQDQKESKQPKLHYEQRI